MRRFVTLALTLVMLSPGPVRADKSLSGEDAAYIDWGAKNCGVASTAKEHAMVDQANAKDRDAFLRQYQSKSESKALTDALATPNKQEAMCTDIKAWYGPLGTRIVDLIRWERAASATADKPAAPAKGDRKGGRRRSGQ
jgi:hypothetical protein